jgi:hypothetical protein
MKRSQLPLGRQMFERMLMVADMDFLIIMARRFLRTAAQARQIPSNNQVQLKRAIGVFNSRWPHLTKVRDALEHFDRVAMFPVPVTAVPTSPNAHEQMSFMWPGGNLDIGELFKDAQSILSAILKVLEAAKAGDIEAMPESG